VLNARQQIYGVQRDLGKSRHDCIFGRLRLKVSAGTLGDEDFVQVNL